MISAELRAAVKASGLTPYAIGQATGLAKNTVVQFLEGRSPSLDNAEKIAAAVGKSLRLGKNSGKILPVSR